MEREKITIYTDGGSRGNPGPAAIGVVIEGPGIGKKEYAEYIGVTTNNEAEYQAVIFALKKTKQLIGADKAKNADIVFYMDSELLVKQFNHEYKIKEENLQRLFLEVHNLRLDFGRIEFRHVLRGKNAHADELLNQILDKEENKLKL
jgi:ribonuclease HI